MKLLITCVMIAASVLAAERAGPYLSAGMGIGNYDDGGRLAGIENDNVIQYRFSAGAFINEYLSVALDYVQYDAFEGKRHDGGMTQQFFKILTADVSGHYAFFDDQLDIFATFGAGELFWEEKSADPKSSSAAALLFGVGAGVRPLPWMTFNVGYGYYQFGMDTGADVYSMDLNGMYLECQVQF